MADESRPVTEFSLRGGPLHRLVEAIGLSEGRRRVVLCLLLIGLSGLPLLALAMAQGVAIGDAAGLPLLRDASVYARVLVAIPWIILCGAVINLRLGHAVRQFAEASLIPAARRTDFDESLAQLRRRCDAWLPDLALLAVAVLAGWLELRAGGGHDHASWLTIGSPRRPTWAGLWFVLVTLPLYQFLMLRWGWRLLLWTLWLRRVSKMGLKVLATHPDRAGGLGFLGEAQAVFNLLVVPISVVFSARAAAWIQFGGGTADELKFVVAAFAIAAVLVVQGPLFVFTPLLAAARRRGILQYGALAGGYVQSFHGKWVEGHNPSGEPLLGTADIQSLADIGNSLAVVQGTQVVPIRLAALAVTAVFAVVPMLPLLSTVIPIQEILKRLVELVAR